MSKISTCMALTALSAMQLPHPVLAQDIGPISVGRSAEAVLCDGISIGPGGWKFRTVQVLAPGNRLQLRRYEVFDPEIDRGLVFSWMPQEAGADRSGRVTGSGSLTWHDHLRMAWDPVGVVKSFVGAMRDGKPNGIGEFIGADGLSYDGAWRDGRPNGRGQLQLPSGESYTGHFLSGCADGPGEFLDTTGERFEGPFHAGRRNGTGKTTLPNGISYTSSWNAGVEDRGSQRVRLAQLDGNASLPGSDIRMGVTVQRRPDLPNEVSIKDIITYSSKPTDGGILVQPSSKDIVSVWKGNGQIQTFNDYGEIHSGIFNYEESFVKSTVPTFMIDVQNRSPDRIQISSLRLRVAESRPDNQPAIQMVILNESCGPKYSTSFRFDNFGWSPAKDVKVNYTFSKTRGPGGPDLSGTFQAGTVVRQKEISFDRALEKLGVDVARLRHKSKSADSLGLEFPCPGGNVERCLDSIRNNKVFGSIGNALSVSDSRIMIKATGTIDYSWTDDRSQSHSRTSPYSVSMEVGHFTILAECGEGPTPVAIKHAPLHLQTEGANYTIAIPFQEAVPAGQSARYTFRMEADQSSNHRFSIVAVLANGAEIVSRPVSLLFFRPRPLAIR